MSITTIKEKIKNIVEQRKFLEELLEQPNLGALRLDTIQALEELNELIEELDSTFPQ